MKSYFKKQKGVVSLITLLGLSVVSLALISTISILAIDELKMINMGNVIDQTYYSAEAGLNEGLYRLIKNTAPGSEYNLNIDGVDVKVEVFNGISATTRRIISTATDLNGNKRQVEIIADTSEFGIGLDHAIQGGSGGIYLDNNSVIVGNVYANGDILPASGGARGEIRGNVWVAHNEDSGDISTMRKVDVLDIDNLGAEGKVFGGNIIDSNIDTSLTYETVSNTYVNGSICNQNNISCQKGVSPPAHPFPLTVEDIEMMKTNIENSGNPILIPIPDDCSNTYADGTFFCVEGSNITISNQKIEGNLYVGNGATLTFDGNVYVTGDIIFDNNVTIKIAPNGDLCTVGEDPDDNEEPHSVLILASGTIEVEPNNFVQGCLDADGNSLSYIMLISTTDAGTSGATDLRPWAIYASNNSDSIVFATIYGMLKVKNNGTLNAAVAKKLFLEPGSKVTFNPNFSSIIAGEGGGGAEVGAKPGTWKEL